MSFGVLKFGETCDRHPQPKFRGQDTRAHIFAPPRPKVEAQKMQASGDWFKPPPKQGDEDATQQRPATTLCATLESCGGEARRAALGHLAHETGPSCHPT